MRSYRSLYHVSSKTGSVMKVLVVTGGIGSGKTSACRFLSDRFGWPVYSADRRVKELYMSSPSLLDAVERELERSFRDGSGAFVPRLLAEVIFADGQALDAVERLVFPELADDFNKWKAERSESEYVILESATILEKPQLKGLGDITLLIDAPVEIRVQRAAVRDSASVADIRKRVASQKMMNDVSSGIKDAPVDYVILNDSSVEDLHEKLTEFVKKYL